MSKITIVLYYLGTYAVSIFTEDQDDEDDYEDKYDEDDFDDKDDDYYYGESSNEVWCWKVIDNQAPWGNCYSKSFIHKTALKAHALYMIISYKLIQILAN